MPSVLIVDDDADVRFVLRTAVEAIGRDVVVAGEAGSGEEAVLLWRELRPDVVVLDQKMPGLSGLEAAATMLIENPGQRIVLCTGSVDAETREAARRLGVRAFVSKVDLARLPEVLRALCAQV